MPPILIAGTVQGTATSLGEPITRAQHNTVEVVNFQRPLVTVTETVGVVGDVLPLPGQVVLIQVEAELDCFTGTNATGLIVRLYSGGAIVPANLLATVTFPVNNPIRDAEIYVLRFVDSQGPGGTVQYTASVQQVGATANGSIRHSRLGVALQV